MIKKLELLILVPVLVAFLVGLKVAYGLPTTMEEVQNEERKHQAARSELESYIFNHNISLELSGVNKTALNISAGWRPIEELTQYMTTELLEVAVTEHMQRCEGKNEGDRINYTISNTDIHIEFPNRSGIC